MAVFGSPTGGQATTKPGHIVHSLLYVEQGDITDGSKRDDETVADAHGETILDEALSSPASAYSSGGIFKLLASL